MLAVAKFALGILIAMVSASNMDQVFPCMGNKGKLTMINMILDIRHKDIDRKVILDR